MLLILLGLRQKNNFIVIYLIVSKMYNVFTSILLHDCGNMTFCWSIFL